MTLPNFSNINSELNAQGNRIKDNYTNKDVLLEISDTLIKMQKEIMYALQNLGYENMPTVKVDMDGVNTKITDATGDIVKLKQSGHELKQSIEGERIRVDGEVKRLSEAIDEKTGKLSKDLEGKVIELTNAISEVKQTADNIKLQVKETTIAFDGKINNVENLLDEKTNKLNSDLQGKIREVSEKVSTIDQKADGIKLEVSNTVKSFETKTTELSNTINSKTEAVSKELNDNLDKRAGAIEGNLNTAKKDLENSINNKTDALSKDLNKKITTVTTNVSKIEQKADNIEISVAQKVSRSDFTGYNIISKINVDESEITIKSGKLSLEGQTYISSPDGRAKLAIVTRAGDAGLDFTIDGMRMLAISKRSGLMNGYTTRYANIDFSFIKLVGNGLDTSDAASCKIEPRGY